MKKIVVSVKDRAASTYGQPLFVPTIGVATRSLQDEVNRADQNNQLHLHPEDFDLYELGEFDDSSGRVSMLDQPRLAARAQDLKK